MTMTYPLFDIGVNLLDSAFDKDRKNLIERAEQAGLIGMIVIGSDLGESEQAIQLCQHSSFPLFSTAGVHPHHAKDVEQGWQRRLKSLLSESSVKAIGEAGLDFNRNYSPPAQQIQVFEQQLELATETQKPLYLHERDAHQTLFEMLRSYRDQLGPCLLHCFTGDKPSLFKYLDLDLHIGITGWVCDERRGLPLLELVHNIPLKRLMIETDAPYLLPRNLPNKPKSRRNEPAYLTQVCEQIATQYQLSAEELGTQTTANAIRFFALQELSVPVK